MNYYVDFAQSGVFNRNNPKPYLEVIQLDLTKEKDCYCTYFQFDETFKDYVLKNKTVSGYKGKYTALYLPIDIDNESDLSKSHKNAIRLVDKLQAEYCLYNADIEIYFSGSKGFHIQIPAECFGGFEPSENLAQIFKKIALELSAGIEIDPVIYEPMRLWRLPNTINSKTDLYKISLTVMELYELSIDQIKDKATKPQNIISSDPTPNDALIELYQKFKVDKPKLVSSTWNSFPKNEKYCIYNMLNNGVPSGERNNALLRMSVYLNQKFNSDILNAIFDQWNYKHNLSIPEIEIRQTIKSSLNGYDYGCNDGLLQKYCSNQCTYYRRKNIELKDIKTISDLEQDYINYIKSIDDSKIDLKHWIPKFKDVSRGITAGEVVIAIAGSGVGKTAFLQNLLWHIKLPAVFFSYELPEILTYERFYQIANKCTGNEVENDYFTKPKSETLKLGLKDTSFVFNSDVKIDDIPNIVQLLEQKSSNKIKIIGVDYLGLVKGGTGSRYERVSYLAERLKDVAKKTNTVVICLTQVSRNEGASGDTQLNITSGKDSGSIENTGDLVLGLWRPNKDNDIIRIEILKNRKGRSGIGFDCLFNKETLEILPYTETNVICKKERYGA